MSESHPSAPVRAVALPALSDLTALLRRGDLGLALAVLAILVVLVLPLPPVLLDLLLAVSIILSILILMTALFVEAPVEFSPRSRPCFSSRRCCGCR